MGWVNLAKGLARLGFALGGDLKKDITLQLAPGGGTYDPITGITSPGTTPNVTIKGFKVRTEEQQRHDDTGRLQTLILKQEDVVNAGFVGQIKETVSALIDGEVWQVLSVGQDPAGATWRLVVQTPS